MSEWRIKRGMGEGRKVRSFSNNQYRAGHKKPGGGEGGFLGVLGGLGFFCVSSERGRDFFERSRKRRWGNYTGETAHEWRKVGVRGGSGGKGSGREKGGRAGEGGEWGF